MNLPFTLDIDNTAAITANSRVGSGQCLKHVDIKYFVMKSYIDSGLLTLKHIPTALQTADILTKRLDHVLLARHRTALGLVPLNDVPQQTPAVTQVTSQLRGSDGI